MRRLWTLLASQRIPLDGFITEEVREDDGRRVGFAIEAITGEKAILAHIELPGPPRVGRYGVDVASFERIALPALAQTDAGVVLIDELGKMELASAAFRNQVQQTFARPTATVATVQRYRHPFTDALKSRRDVELIQVTMTNRDRLPNELLRRLTASATHERS